MNLQANHGSMKYNACDIEMSGMRTLKLQSGINLTCSRTPVLPGEGCAFYCRELMRLLACSLLLFACCVLICPPSMAVQSTHHMMTLDRYYYKNCQGVECCFEIFPEPAAYFFPNDEAAWLWFNWKGARPGDSFSMVTFSPGGALYDHLSSDSLITRKDGCLLLSFSINGSAPEHMPGDWLIKVSVGGDHLFSQRFTILSGKRDAYIVDKTMTLNPHAGSGCAIPPSNHIFYEFDEVAYFWFYFSAAGIGDDVRVDWYAPGGSLYLTQSLSYTDENGCLYPGIAIGGHEAARLPGAWRVTVYYDSGRYCNEYFTVVDSTADEPIPCPLSLIYGNDSPQVQTLRNFRDTVLRRTPEGRELIRLYYQWGPFAARAIAANDQVREEAEQLADAVLLMMAGRSE